MTDKPRQKNTLIRNNTAEFLIFTGQSGEQSIETRYKDETIWLSQKLMSALFNVDVRTINEHLKNIYEQGEVSPDATIRKFRIVQTEGKRKVSRSVDFYNLDAIISVGYRVNSVRATQFRQWATKILVEAIKRRLNTNFACYRPTVPTNEDLLEGFSKDVVIKELESFVDNAKKAIDSNCEKTASEHWRKLFGDRFPLGKEEEKSATHSSNAGLIRTKVSSLWLSY